MHRFGLLAAAFLLLAACGGDGADTATVVLEGESGATTIAVEVADSPEERRQGLRGREELDADSGMVFLFGELVDTQFVMEDTLIPLSIAFLDEAGRVVAIRDMEPCRADPCPSYRADRPYSAALEVNRGAFERWGVGLGDRIRVEADGG